MTPRHQVGVYLWEPVQPIARGERYEDPLFDALEQAGQGEAGDGGGSLCSKDGEIEQVDFDVMLTTLDAIPLVTRVLEEAGAPKGSELHFERDGEDVVVSFGVAEGLAIYLDGVGLADEVYTTTSAQDLLDRLLAALGDGGGGGEFRGSWAGPSETALYLYGGDADQMFTALEPILRSYPLCQNARVIVRHGNPSLGPQELRMGRLHTA